MCHWSAECVSSDVGSFLLAAASGRHYARSSTRRRRWLSALPGRRPARLPARWLRPMHLAALAADSYATGGNERRDLIASYRTPSSQIGSTALELQHTGAAV